MPKKPKTNQPETENIVQGRDLFQTPNYATELLLPYIPNVKHIWEPACGQGKISNILSKNYNVVPTDLDMGINFLSCELPEELNGKSFAIVTNPPFSLKRKFYERCVYWNVAFALLIPADICGWVVEAFEWGCSAIVPSRRIDYITPTGKSGKTSASQFHSWWLVNGFKTGQNQLTFVDLTKEMKENI